MSSSSGRRAQVLAVLRGADEPMSIAAIAAELDIHLNTVRFHLDALMSSGQVKRAAVKHAKPGRPPQLFHAVQGMDPGGPRRYELLATVLADTVTRGADPAGQAHVAGRDLGARLGESRRVAARSEPVGQLVELLDDLGFAPTSTGDELRIGLRHCPFLEVAKRHPGVVCRVHLGLMQGATEAWDASLSVAELVPFVEPDLCVAQLVETGEKR
jgi:predicted ArsR family transcriptional regulator